MLTILLFCLEGAVIILLAIELIHTIIENRKINEIRKKYYEAETEYYINALKNEGEKN
ncbi:MAG: hypothetical protein RR557_06150 [Bacilli bacterium]